MHETTRHAALKRRWDVALARIVTAISYEGQWPKDPAVAIEYASLAVARSSSVIFSLLVLNGPPGAGKSTLGALLERDGLRRIPRVTDRPRRFIETDGQHYRFVSPEQFHRLASENQLWGVKQTWGSGRGYLKGDFKGLSGDAYTEGENPLRALREAFAAGLGPNPNHVLHAVIIPPSFDEWVRRLRQQKDAGYFDQDALESRLRDGLGYIERSLDHRATFPHTVYLVNDDPLRLSPILQKVLRAQQTDICFEVTEQGAPGRALTKEYAHALGILHPIVVIYVFDENKRLLLQQRASTQQWDHSAAGHLAVGETPIQAADRELQEELNIKGRLRSHGSGIAEHVYIRAGSRHLFHCFSLTTTGPFTPNSSDVQDLRLVTLADFEQWLATEPSSFSGGLHATFPWFKKYQP